MRGLPRAVLRRSQRWPCALMPARTCNRREKALASAGSSSKGRQFVMPSLREHTMPHTAAECCSIAIDSKVRLATKHDGLYAVWRNYLKRGTNSGVS